MVEIFIVNEYKVTPSPEVLLMSPFNKIWEKDKSVRKQKAMKEFAYIEFMTSPKKSNPFRDLNDEDRDKVICEDIMEDVNYQPSELVKEGINKINQMYNDAFDLSYYRSTINAANKMKDFFNGIDPNVLNAKTGNPLYKPKEILSALNDTSNLLETLAKLRKKIEEGLEAVGNSKVRANKRISPFADPNSV